MLITTNLTNLNYLTTRLQITVIFAISIFKQTLNVYTATEQLDLFTNATAFDGTTSKLLSRDVLVEDNIIGTISEEPIPVIQTAMVTFINAS